MIVIGRSIVHPYITNENEPFATEKQQILAIMTGNQEVYSFRTADELSFDLNLRINIITSALELFQSGFQFRTFQQSFCNPEFWQRTSLGGFQLRPGVPSSVAIRDIFKNGKMYGTECATAMIIIFYKALLALYDEETFNHLFANLLLYTWDYDHDLKLITKTGGDIVPGDLVYFKNPQVNPASIEWQGENAIYLGNYFYYGHGVGVKTKEQIIYLLNDRRIPYAFISAYLTDFITRIDSRLMSQHASTSNLQTTLGFIPIRDDAIVATIGHTTTIY
ncbi:protein-glutamine gamma-glutamyltransferase [Bacillus pseudomycoides]|uniref:Protein-glutamine gamma-glutamyltransferase n=1 Tax=Bacillus pseudomycoides TaxID=64104 RepID=A0AA91VG31_9BACI|nr:MULTISPECIES: protein-glutamine gamma-glutamyltransferase [Bacillus]PEB54966.1 protein-glutamine gamma-glutamyltransferase [Bacillus sp. AFS098217]PED84381.1 protein-glutamine gamma-glutamyltransferase [Bacillus pseudomycoides]PEU15908.1 protein-glutamine gamma-glutamyltransferase [Bacillus sp. AFS019443]PEU20596.1 protein-glutamine gamma-glutamyltransferase [Bacillus sp. AFS014408]PFW64792.1 protein-glutamine gamma-glutamyltransferase [Bacillus sp. AFS075034]